MRSKEKKGAVCLLLCLCLLFAGASPAYALTEQKAVDETFRTLIDRIAAVNAVYGYGDDTVIQYFVEVTMYGEYDGYRGYLMRYEDPIRYFFMGQPDEEDKAVVRRLAEELNKVEGFPGISEVEYEWDANVKVMFSTMSEYENYFSLTVPAGSWGYSSVWYYTDPGWLGEMSSTNIWISNDAWPRRDRDSVICEEFIQGLGMLNDPEYGYYSIFDQNRNDCDWPSDLDWAVVHLLYDPQMSRDLSEEAARAAAQRILNSWK